MTMQRKLFGLFALCLSALAVLFAPAARADYALGDGICETTQTTGQGTLSLDGAYTSGTIRYLPFASQVASGSTVPYTIESSDGKFEHGEGVFTDATPDTLTRTNVVSSDGVGVKLSLPSGNHIVCLQWGTSTFTGGVAGVSFATVTVAGSTSGTTSLKASATASGTLTLPAATDTLVGKATTDTFTNKTYDTAGTGNVFKLSGTQVTTASSILDIIGSTQGDILYRDASGWSVLAPGTSGQVLTTGGSGANPSWTDAGSGTVVVQVFTSPGTYTYTPTSGMKYAIIECVGGGGSGGGAAGSPSGQGAASGGGGSGQYARKLVTAADIGASKTVTVGAGGAAVTGNTNGNAGGATSVGTLCIAAGGGGGTGASTGSTPGGQTGGIGGFSGGVGDVVVNGQAGSPGMRFGGSGTQSIAGNGAPGPFGGGGQGARANSSTANGQAGSKGGGGSGAATQNNGSVNATSGAGGDGLVIITEFL